MQRNYKNYLSIMKLNFILIDQIWFYDWQDDSIIYYNK